MSICRTARPVLRALNNQKAIPATSYLRPQSSLHLHTRMAPTSSSSKPRPIVLSGPSGTGKSTLLKRLMNAHPNTFGFSVSHTTRQPRPNEQDGREYNFVTREAFTKLKEQGGFIETAEFGGNMYGTSVKAVEDVASGHAKGSDGSGKALICILDIEMEGVKQVKQKPELDARICFLQPPSVEELDRRLRGRGTEKEDAIQKRLKQAGNEMKYANEMQEERARRGESEWDRDFLVLVNDDLERAYKKLEGWVVDGGRFGRRE